MHDAGVHVVCDDQIGQWRRWPEVRPRLSDGDVAMAPADVRTMVRFLDTAEEAGYEPRVDPWGVAGSGCEATAGLRHVYFVRRMREPTPEGRQQRWETVLVDCSDPPRRAASGFVLGFGPAAEIGLRWLQGEDEETLWAALSPIATHRRRNDEWTDMR